MLIILLTRYKCSNEYHARVNVRDDHVTTNSLELFNDKVRNNFLFSILLHNIVWSCITISQNSVKCILLNYLAWESSHKLKNIEYCVSNFWKEMYGLVEPFLMRLTKCGVVCGSQFSMTAWRRAVRKEGIQRVQEGRQCRTREGRK